jgi:hypothetical protein
VSTAGSLGDNLPMDGRRQVTLRPNKPHRTGKTGRRALSGVADWKFRQGILALSGVDQGFSTWLSQRASRSLKHVTEHVHASDQQEQTKHCND